MTSNQLPVVCSFESRRATEMSSLIERNGGRPLMAPSMRERPLQQNSEAVDVIRRIVAGDVDAMILLTGVGTDAMLELAKGNNLDEQLRQQMQQVPQWVRGPKPAAALKRIGVNYALKAPEPNTWRELIEAIDASGVSLNGMTLAVQEYGVTNPELNQALQQRGATVLTLPVYRWDLPEDIGPLRHAIAETIAGEVDILMFTSAQQIRHVLQVAAEDGKAEAWLQAAQSCHVASIGPTCSETMQEVGLPVHFEASPPKMGPLVKGALQTFGQL